jgi:hypothetical protein
VSLGVARVDGSGQDFTGYNVFGGKDPEAPATFEGKAHGILSIDGVLYMNVVDQGQWMRGKMYRSTDHGHTWTPNDGGWFFEEPDGVFGATAFLTFGKDYEGARDTYVYGYCESRRGVIQPNIDMFRVPKDQIMDRSAVEFFAGLDGSGNPEWTSDVTQRQPVFSDPNGVDWGVQVTYNPALQRYLLTVRHDDSGGWGIFDAPEPWGPWTTVAYEDNWIDSQKKFTFIFNQKWMSADGKTMYMVFSGTGTYDSFNVLKGTLSLRN